MGSSSKKHKKDREMSRKHKLKSRSRSPPMSPGERDRRHHKRSSHRDRKRRPDRVEEFHSDSSDCVEVPLAPPAPVISRANRSPSPFPEGGAGDSLSIAETNKIRAKLGLKPLEVEAGPSGARDGKEGETGKDGKFKDDWGEFFHKPADNLAEKAQSEKIRERLKETKEKRTLEEKLTKIPTLGQEDGDDSATHWVNKSRSKEQMKMDAQKRAKLLEEMDAEFGVGELIAEEIRDTRRSAYKERDLVGLKVQHDAESFSEGKTVILTLQDQDVLNEEGDTLVNVNMIDDERYKKNVENKKMNPQHYGYNVFSDEIVDEYGLPKSRPILGKYDEEIDGKQKSQFTIGVNVEEEKAKRRHILEIKTKLAHKKLESLNDSALQLASEYYSEKELEKFKKPKKKVKKGTKKLLKADDLLEMTSAASSISRDLGRRKRIIDQEDLDLNSAIDSSENLSDMKVEVDDDLEQVLAKARRLKQKESLIQKPVSIEMVAIKDEIKTEENSDDEKPMVSDGNIMLNATAEFCRTLGDIPTYGMAGNRDDEVTDLMDFDMEVGEHEDVHEEPESSTGTWNTVNPNAVVVESNENSMDVADVAAILDEEPDVSSGIAGALRLAMSKGYLEREESNRPSNTRMAHLQAKNYSIEDKTYTEDEKFGRRDRFHSGPLGDFKEKETFKPNVKLEYIDDSGRVLNPKEAFRYLSHKFHGKGPGKNKIEKRLKKNEQEGLMMKMSSTDTPLGTLNMLQAKQRETQSAYVVLSGTKQSTSISKHKMK